MLGKRNYGIMMGARRPNIGPLLPPGMGGGFRRTKRAVVVRKGFTRTAGFYGRYNRPRRAPTQELKFFDTDLTFAVDNTAEVPATGQLTLIPQGDTQSTRDGRAAYIKSIRVHGTVTAVPAAAANLASTAIVYVILDTQCNGAAATASGDTGVVTSADLTVANMNLANGDRFKILKKFVWTFNSLAGVTTAYGNVQRHFDWYKKCNITINYDNAAGTGAITTIRSNNIFLLAGSAGSDDVINVAGSCRLRFTD